MSDLANLHAADGSILGFLFQIERAMLWLSSSDLKAIVGVEVDDDITVRLTSGEEIHSIYEQAKHSVGKKIPYSNQSEDLWKTLSIWVEAVMLKRIDVNHSIFSFLTNKKMPAKRLVISLDKEKFSNYENINHKNKSILNLARQLKEIALKLPKSLKPYGEIVIDCPDDILIKIIDRISILDSGYDHVSNDFKHSLRNNLRISKDIPFDYIYRGLFGYVTDTLIMLWRRREPGWITVEAFNQQYTQLLTEFKKKSFYEKTVDSLPVGSSEIEKNRGKVFVEQLNKIGCGENEIIEAIYDYTRATSERSRFAKDGEISMKKFDIYFNDLRNYWESVSRPAFKFASKDDYMKVGYKVYYKSILYKGKLNNYEPEQGYTHKGSFHYLADLCQLGWHPEWTILKEENGETK